MSHYFDHNATTPVFPEARDTMLQAMDEHWQNPSSLYHSAGAVRQALEETREAFAELLAVDDPARIMFLSGATEANHAVMRHFAEVGSVIVSAIEHPSVNEPAKREFGSDGVVVSTADDNGAVDLAALEILLREKRPALVSVMAANNETGVLQPWQAIRDLCRDLETPFHCDAAQWLGKMRADGLGDCDFVTGSAHKFGGPKGVGFLIVPSGLESFSGAQMGGPQEAGRRAGTENYPAIAGMLTALERCAEFEPESALRLEFESQITGKIPGTKVIAAKSERLWNTSMLVMPKHGNLKWLTRLSHLGFEVSTGSACSSGKDNPSHVMAAMGLRFEEMGRVLRISSGWNSTTDDWSALSGALAEVWSELENPSRERRQKRTISL